MAKPTPMADKMQTRGYRPDQADPAKMHRGGAFIFDMLVASYIRATKKNFAEWAETWDFGPNKDSNGNAIGVQQFMRNYGLMPVEEQAAWAIKRLQLNVAWRELDSREFVHRLTDCELNHSEFGLSAWAEDMGTLLYRNDFGPEYYFRVFRDYFEKKAGTSAAVRIYDLLGDHGYEMGSYKEAVKRMGNDGIGFMQVDEELIEEEEYRVLRVPNYVYELNLKLDKAKDIEANILSLLRKAKLHKDLIGYPFFEYFEEVYKKVTVKGSNSNALALFRAWRMLESDKQGPRGGYRGGEMFDDAPGDESSAAVGSRIRALRLQRGMTGVQLASAVGIRTPQAISAWENGHTMPPDERLEKCAKALGTTVQYLRTGVKQELGEADNAAMLGYKAMGGDISVTDAIKESGLIEKLATAGMIDYAEVPLFTASVSAGSGEIVFEETPEQPLWFRKSFFEKRGLLAKDCRCFHVHGDSMEPYLADGDVVLTGGKPEQIKDGMLYVLRYGTDLRVKRLRTTHTGGLILMSDNPRYPEEEISASDAEKYITVLGQVHWRGG